MVRAGVVKHPGQWKESAFSEIQKPPKRYAIIDLQSLSELSGFADVRDFQRAHRQWVEHALENGRMARNDRWSESIAVGSLAFVEQIKSELGIKALHRDFEQVAGAYELRESRESYGLRFTGENDLLTLENTISWNENAEAADA
jgi:REP-associated tyrosine transposase